MIPYFPKVAAADEVILVVDDFVNYFSKISLSFSDKEDEE